MNTRLTPLPKLRMSGAIHPRPVSDVIAYIRTTSCFHAILASFQNRSSMPVRNNFTISKRDARWGLFTRRNWFRNHLPLCVQLNDRYQRDCAITKRILFPSVYMCIWRVLFCCLETSVFDVRCNKHVSVNVLRGAAFTAIKTRH